MVTWLHFSAQATRTNFDLANPKHKQRISIQHGDFLSMKRDSILWFFLNNWQTADSFFFWKTSLLVFQLLGVFLFSVLKNNKEYRRPIDSDKEFRIEQEVEVKTMAFNFNGLPPPVMVRYLKEPRKRIFRDRTNPLDSYRLVLLSTRFSGYSLSCLKVGGIDLI